jgi:hypothetical protein
VLLTMEAGLECFFSWLVSLEMERRFLMEAKSFVFSVLDGASMLRVEEMRKDFFPVRYS